VFWVRMAPTAISKGESPDVTLEDDVAFLGSVSVGAGALKNVRIEPDR